MQKLVFIGLIFPLLYMGCGESKMEAQKNEINVTSKSAVEVVIPSDTEREKDLLHQLGFDVNNQKISIDMNKTTEFFKRMEIEMHGKADEIQHKIERADINFTRDIGISLENERIAIDLNKTKKMFQQINILMKEVLLDGNSSEY